jgi:6-phospho-beta-glucosidase
MSEQRANGKGPRIVVIGGGSQFAIGLSESLVDYGRDLLVGATVVLLDVREDNLRIVEGYANRLSHSMGVDMRFEATTDRRAAFAGADYLLTTFRPGSHAQLIEDETIPVKHGLQGNETVGIGGIFMACRVAPVLREICADAEEMCPDAWIINYTNPTQFVADTVQRISSMRIISLCDGYVGDVESLAYVLGVDPASITIQVAGTNHAMWLTDFTVAGEDGYALLRERLAELGPAGIDALFPMPTSGTLFDETFSYEEIYKQFIKHYGYGFHLRLFELYGLLPGPRYYWRYMLDQDAIIAAQRNGDYVTMGGFYTKHLEPRLFADLEQKLETARHELSSTRREGGGGHGDLAVRVIASMVNNTGERFVVNVKNHGAVSNLPYDAILELSAYVDRHGAHTLAVGDLPEPVVGLQEALVHSQQLAVTAALSGSKDDLLRAIVAHPLINSVAAAEACMNELLALQAEWLPQFHRQLVSA